MASILTLVVFFALTAGAVYILTSERFREYATLHVATLVCSGLDATCEGTFVKANDPGEVPREWFHARTLILG